MKRYLFNLIFSIVLMLVCAQAYSQVKLADSGVTKFYEDGTRITYFEMDGFPNSVEVRDFVSKIVLEHPDIRRVHIYKNGATFMYDAAKEIEPEMIIDAINDALADFGEVGYSLFEEKDENGKLKSASAQPTDRRNSIEEDAAPADPASFQVIPVERPNSSSSKKSNDSFKTK
ncbi:MAG: hypothetical protein IKJ56_02540 [Bacteroidales bacterium]|nr:hypothetical protein [Bacteroidales bacterium]